MLIPPAQCHGGQVNPNLCVCLQSLATGIVAGADVASINIGSDAVRMPFVPEGVFSTYMVECERPDITTLRELFPLLAGFLDKTIGAGRFELSYRVYDMSRLTRPVPLKTTSKMDPDSIPVRPGRAPGIEKISGWFPCIPFTQGGESYPPDVMQKLMQNRLGIGTHFVILEPEPDHRAN